jgi:two-component system, OmpR family, KDP operon response regulator KdpE
MLAEVREMVKTGKKCCVLVVDDHPKVLKFIEIDLKLRGFEVVSTCSGKEALELISSRKPDILLLDMIMPETDGFEVLKEMRTFTDTPVIAFSASPGNQDQALRLGANDFMNKPFDPDDMARKIRALIK